MRREATVCVAMMLIWCGVASAADRGYGSQVRAPDGSIVQGNNWVLLIGIDRYKEWKSLQYPVSDVQKFKRIILDRYCFNPEHVVERINEQATKRGINEAMEHLLGKLGADDSLLIYYSGHGYKHPSTGVGYWVPHDAGTDRVARTNYINNADVRGVIESAKCRHVLLISDSCFSGDLLDTKKGQELLSGATYYRAAWERRSRQALTSGASEEVPDRSWFAHHLRDVLGSNQRQYLDPEDIHAYVKKGVEQLPQIGSLADAGHVRGGSYVFLLRAGWIQVRLTPDDATLVVNGEPVGSKRRIERQPGEYELKASGSGYYSAKTTVCVLPNETSPVEIVLRKKPRFGSLEVRCNVAGADVRVDGKSIGKTERRHPLSARDIAVGRHTIVATHGAYSDWRKQVVVTAGETETVTIAMEKSRTGAAIVSRPSVAPRGSAEEPSRRGLTARIAAMLTDLRDVGRGSARVPRRSKSFTNGTDRSQMVSVPAGTFRMGSHDMESSEMPVHDVHVEAFYISKYEITNRQFKKFVDANPEWCKGRVDSKLVTDDYLEHWEGDTYPSDKADHPVVYVSWFAAKAYCKWAAGRLPTEAEWEYACRAGSTGEYCFGDDGLEDGFKLGGYAWYALNSGGSPHPVGQKEPNGWGIHDMHGNVWEWCSSKYCRYPYNADDGREDPNDTSSRRVVRGGGCLGGGASSNYCRSAARLSSTSASCSGIYGFRLCISAEPPK